MYASVVKPLIFIFLHNLHFNDSHYNLVMIIYQANWLIAIVVKGDFNDIAGMIRVHAGFKKMKHWYSLKIIFDLWVTRIFR